MNEQTTFKSPQHRNYMCVDFCITQRVRNPNQFYPKVTEKELRELYEVTRPVYTPDMLDIDKKLK